jgi:tetratricopeptide (TPR) repeat protein
MRKLAAIILLAGVIAALPASAAEEGARPAIVDVLTARLATASSPDEAAEIADALREVYGQSQSPSAEVLYTQSEVIAAEGDTENALYKLTRALLLDDDLVGALVLRGDVRLDVGNVDEAYEDALAAVDLAPDYYASLGLLARAFEAQGRYVSALATTRRALDYYPLSEDLQDQLARHEALAAGGAAGL